MKPRLCHRPYWPTRDLFLVTVSVIIPTLNEESCIAGVIANVRTQNPHEIIVIDGGSCDATVRLAAGADMILSGSRGRARQMNAGARNATGDVLLFLHADCLLAPTTLDQAQKLLQKRSVVGGCFHMRIPAPGLLYRSIESCATARVRLSGIVYGDQGLFLKRDRFESMGGYPEIDLLEDMYFSLKLRRQGRLSVAQGQILVSPRRWQRAGLVKQTARNWAITALAGAGADPNWLARFYAAIR
jgi:rSAM/selenodomain-associated transferase 2